MVVDFEWNSRIQNEVLENYGSVIIPLSIRPRYLTICGGEGSILVVSGPLKVNQNQTEIQFFDLTDLNAVNGNLKPFAVIDLVSNAEIIDLDWHPEFNESLFAAVLSTGELISVGVNLAEKRAQILFQLNQNEKITCVSWSPKGKQIVIGKENGEIIQLKHTDGTAFQEAKKINPDPELIGYEVNAIKWCFTFLFMVSYAKTKSEQDFEVKHITVHAPSKTVPVFYNYTQLCIESFKKELRYKTDFIHLGGVILCSTSYSSEVGVLVCDDTEKSVHSWNQLMLADDHRVELPMSKKNQTLSKGIIMYFENAKTFKINETEVIGGLNNPLMTILNSDGVLCSFFVSYPKLSRPIVFPTKQLKFPNIVSNQEFSLNQSAINQSSLNRSALSVSSSQQTPTKSFTNQSPQQQQSQNFVQQQQQQQQTSPQINQQQLQQQLQQQKAQQEQEKLIALQQQLQQQKQAAKEAELQKEKERKQIMEENHAYLIAIDEEILQFSRLVLESKERYKRTNSLIVGKESEKRALIDLTNSLEFELDQIKESFKAIDIELLENFLLENFAMAEDARSRAERDKDSKLNILFQKKPLDPVTQRKLKEINNKTIYIETNLKEINYILDQQWQDYIVSEKGKKQNVVSPVNLVYQSLANNHRILTSLEAQLRAIEPVLSWKDANHKINYKKQDIKKLTGSLKKANLNDDDFSENGLENNEENDDNLIEIHRFTNKNRQNLLRFLDARPEIPIKRSSLPVDINSTIMISAISKAKEKLKLSKKQVEKHHHHHQTVKNNAVVPQQRLQAPALNKKLIEQQQQQKLAQSKQVPSQQVKSTATFVPPVLSQSQQIIPQQKTGQINSNKQQLIQQQLQMNKAMPIAEKTSQPTGCAGCVNSSKVTSELFKFSFNSDQIKQSINFSQLDQTKQIQQQISPKTTAVKTTLPPQSSVIFAGNQPQDKTEFTFKPEQLNLTFDKNQLNLLSSTPIKNQQQPAQQTFQKTDSAINLKTDPLFGTNKSVLTKPVESSDAIKQTSISANTQQPEDLQKINTSLSSKYEDISPATTPTVDPKSQLISGVKPIDPTTFSFNALTALSKMPISSTVASNVPLSSSNTSSTPALTSSQPLSSLSNMQNIQNQQNVQQKTKENISASNQPILNFNLPSSIFSQLPSNKDAQQSTSTVFGNNSTLTSTDSQQPSNQTSTLTQTNVFNPNSSPGLKSNTTFANMANLTTTQQTNVTKIITPVTTTSIFSMSSTTGGAINLSATKKDSQLFTTPVQQQTNLSSVTQQSISTPNQQSNIQSPISAFSNIQQPATSIMSPFASQSVASTQANQQLGFSSMCGLGGKPNPENEKKNPFGSISVSSSAPSTGLLFGGASQQSFSSASTPNQPISSPSAFSVQSFQTSGFGSPPTFGVTPMSNASLFNNPANTSSILSKPTFGMQTSFGQQPTTQQTSPFQQNTSAFQQSANTSGFGAKSTFGSTTFNQTSFGSPNSSFKFGSQPMLGSSIGSPNTTAVNFNQTKTGFERYEFTK